MQERINILDLDHEQAKNFFLKHESYCNFDLPKYFSFSELLNNLSNLIQNKKENSYIDKKNIPAEVNHVLYVNKSGKLSWRPLQLIHPLLYVRLVHEITKKDNWDILKNRFKQFQKHDEIKCLSIPVESKNKESDKAHQIKQWWQYVEQESIFLSLKYNHIFDTDISDCYGSIYTHSIAWAIEGKDVAKKQRRNETLGNNIDKKMRELQDGQTNGIPQGSVLMDFIAEIILGYIDDMLIEKLKEKNINTSEYKILRYRDDYRIFVKQYETGENILKYLAEIMIPFGLKINTSKTSGSSDVITQ